MARNQEQSENNKLLTAERRLRLHDYKVELAEKEETDTYNQIKKRRIELQNKASSKHAIVDLTNDNYTSMSNMNSNNQQQQQLNNAFSSSSSSMPNFFALHNPINLNSIQNIDNLNNSTTAINVGFHQQQIVNGLGSSSSTPNLNNQPQLQTKNSFNNISVNMSSNNQQQQQQQNNAFSSSSSMQNFLAQPLSPIKLNSIQNLNSHNNQHQQLPYNNSNSFFIQNSFAQPQNQNIANNLAPNMNSNNQQQQQLNNAFSASSSSMPNFLAQPQNQNIVNNVSSFNSLNSNENGHFLGPLNQNSLLKLNQHINFNNQQQQFQFHNNRNLNNALTTKNPQYQHELNQVFSPSSFVQNYYANHHNQSNLLATVSNMNLNNKQQQFQTGHLLNNVLSNISSSELNNQQPNQYDLTNHHQHQQQQFQNNNLSC